IEYAFEGIAEVETDGGHRDYKVTGVQTCALPILTSSWSGAFMLSIIYRWAVTVSARSAKDLPRTANVPAPPAGIGVVDMRGGSQIGRASCRERAETAGAGGSRRKRVTGMTRRVEW